MARTLLNTTFKSYFGVYILMNRIFLVTLTMVLSLGLVSFALIGTSSSNGQQNQTSNATSTQQPQQGGQQQQQNQSEGIGTAIQIENMTAGNIPVIGNETDIKSQNDTSVAAGMQKEQLTTDTNKTNNQTAGGTANQTTNATANQTQSEGNDTGGGAGNDNASNPLEQIGETISGIFGGGGN